MERKKLLVSGYEAWAGSWVCPECRKPNKVIHLGGLKGRLLILDGDIVKCDEASGGCGQEFKVNILEETVFLLNAPVLTSWGKYTFEPITPEGAREWLWGKRVISAIGHQATAEVLTKVLGFKVPVNRIQVEMQPGSQALVFRLLTRLEEGKVLSKEELEALPYEIGILTRAE